MGQRQIRLTTWYIFKIKLQVPYILLNVFSGPSKWSNPVTNREKDGQLRKDMTPLGIFHVNWLTLPNERRKDRRKMSTEKKRHRKREWEVGKDRERLNGKKEREQERERDREREDTKKLKGCKAQTNICKFNMFWRH